MNAYHSHFPITPPEEDLDARLALYSLRRYDWRQIDMCHKSVFSKLSVC
jgi:hypothetical protein